MKTIFKAIILINFSLTFGQDFQLLQSQDDIIIINHELEEKPKFHSYINGKYYRDFTKSHKVTYMELGSPALPYFSESIIVPNKGQISLLIEHDGYIEYENIEVSPSKGNLKRNINPSDIPFTFGETYNENKFFPGNLAFLGNPFNLRNTRGVTISFSPYQYNPVTKIMRVYKNIKANIIVNPLEKGQKELNTTYKKNDVFNSIYKNMYINSNILFGRYTPLEEEGDMLIITHDAFTAKIQPLADWKNQSGIKTTIVSTSTTGSTDTQIKSYIQNFYSTNPDLVYILLVGDHFYVPSHSYGNSGGEQLWSDSYYGQLTGGSNDFYPEAFVGRFSGNPTQITTMVNRTIEYEKSPLSGNWMTKAIGLASDEGQGFGDDGEADWQHARNMRSVLLNYGYTSVYEFYDGSHGGQDASGDPNPNMIIPVVNNGIGLFNYTGHGDQNTCVTGNYSSSDINNGTNNGAYPYVISVACNNGTFTSGTCISETWLRATNNSNPTGAIAACGSSILMSWAPPMQTQDEMTELISETYLTNRKSTLGGLFYNAQMSMLEDYNSNTTAKEVMQTWVMFGDPSTVFRNKVTMNMSVSHIGNVPLGTNSINVNCDTDGTKISISQENNLLGYAIVNNGSADISITSLTSNQPLVVTGTKQNYNPYQGIITVADGPAGINTNILENIIVYPNPASHELNIKVLSDNQLPDLIELVDLTGKIIYSNNRIQSENTRINTISLSSGIYLLNVKLNNKIKIHKVVIK